MQYPDLVQDRARLTPMAWVNVVFEVVGAFLVLRALKGCPVEDVLGWSALWAIECVPYYLSVGDTASAAAASVRAAACGAYWIQKKVWS